MNCNVNLCYAAHEWLVTHRLRTNVLRGVLDSFGLMCTSCATVLCVPVLAYPSDMSSNAASGPWYLLFSLAATLTCISHFFITFDLDSHETT